MSLDEALEVAEKLERIVGFIGLRPIQFLNEADRKAWTWAMNSYYMGSKKEAKIAQVKEALYAFLKKYRSYCNALEGPEVMPGMISLFQTDFQLSDYSLKVYLGYNVNKDLDLRDPQLKQDLIDSLNYTIMKVERELAGL